MTPLKILALTLFAFGLVGCQTTEFSNSQLSQSPTSTPKNSSHYFSLGMSRNEVIAKHGTPASVYGNSFSYKRHNAGISRDVRRSAVGLIANSAVRSAGISGLNRVGAGLTAINAVTDIAGGYKLPDAYTINFNDSGKVVGWTSR